MHGFTNKELLNIHWEQSCKSDNAQRTKMPIDDPVLQFTNVHKQLKAPFVAYADFECILEDVRDHGDKEVDTKTNITKATPDVDSNAKIYQEHVPCSFAFKVASIDSNYDLEIVLYIGEDAAETLIAASEIFEQYIKHPKPMIPLTLAEERKLQQAETCHICHSWKLPVLFHNLRGYDGHLIVKVLKRWSSNCKGSKKATWKDPRYC